MSHHWRVRVQPAERTPYEFKATLLLRSGGDANMLAASYLYGDGDLAVFLEDLGADASEICGLIQRLQGRRSAEILVDVSEEAMEVLSRRGSEPRA